MGFPQLPPDVVKQNAQVLWNHDNNTFFTVDEHDELHESKDPPENLQKVLDVIKRTLIQMKQVSDQAPVIKHRSKALEQPQTPYVDGGDKTVYIQIYGITSRTIEGAHYYYHYRMVAAKIMETMKSLLNKDPDIGKAAYKLVHDSRAENQFQVIINPE